MLDGDIAQTLGAILREELLVESEILAIDGVMLRDFDYIDLGRIRMPSYTVPVTIKSLVFSEDPTAASRSASIITTRITITPTATIMRTAMAMATVTSITITDARARARGRQEQVIGTDLEAAGSAPRPARGARATRQGGRPELGPVRGRFHMLELAETPPHPTFSPYTGRRSETPCAPDD